MHKSRLWIAVAILILVVVSVVFLYPKSSTVTPQRAAIQDLSTTLEASREKKEPVALVSSQATKSLEEELHDRSIDFFVLREGRPQYYANQLIPKLRKRNRLWLVFDHREEGVRETLRNLFLRDHRIDVDREFLHLTLLRVVNEFSHGGSAVKRLRLVPIAKAGWLVSDIQFMPGGDTMFMATKHGTVKWKSLGAEQEGGVVLKLPSLDGNKEGLNTAQESGLIGLAFHPSFEKTRKFYTHYNYKLGNGSREARVSEWRLDVSINPKGIVASGEKILLRIPQTSDNHNAGQLTFGPDGYLYIAVGDGLEGEWTKGRAPSHTLRGKILRIDVHTKDTDKPYGIPPTNPFVGNKRFPPEAWAWGFRNPWRISFTPDGRLLAGDVGEDRREEITFVKPGRHHGWPFKEGTQFRNEWVHGQEDPVSPVFDYGRELGMAVIGGYVYEGAAIEWLHGKYVFGDYESGRIWALNLPGAENTKKLSASQVMELGRWPLMFTTFGKDTHGKLYVGDMMGQIYRLEDGGHAEGGSAEP